jgi:hypothetical protein
MFLVPVCIALATGGQPDGLLVNYQAGLALGVGPEVDFAWIVPSCDAATKQTAYRVVLQESSGHGLEWDSGKVLSNTSINVRYRGPPLAPGTTYQWNVQTWSGDGLAATTGEEECESTISEDARFITALFDGWDAGAQWIWPTSAGAVSDARFAFFRRVIDIAGTDNKRCSYSTTTSSDAPNTPTAPTNSTPTSAPLQAVLYVTASVDQPILAAFRVFLDGDLLAVGPGRGEVSSIQHWSPLVVTLAGSGARPGGG